MALPSTSRPKELEDELAATIEQENRKKMVLKVAKGEVFYSRLSDWVENLSAKEKRRITPLVLKRRAVKICAEHEIAYGTLPENWVTRFLTEFKITLRVKKERKEAEPSALEAALISKNRMRGCQQKVEPKKKDAERDSSSQSDKEDGKPKVTKSNDKKTVLDLSCVPAPPAWMKAWCDGKQPARFLATYTMEDLTILYWDYAPRLRVRDSLGQEIILNFEPRSLDETAANGVFQGADKK